MRWVAVRFSDCASKRQSISLLDFWMVDLLFNDGAKYVASG
jgi:hypothetical protein